MMSSKIASKMAGEKQVNGSVLFFFEKSGISTIWLLLIRYRLTLQQVTFCKINEIK